MDPVSFLSVHSYRMITLGTFLIGLICGALGTYLYLRKQALLSDVIGHSSTLGVMGAFYLSVAVFGLDGRALLVLVIGSVLAAITAVLLSDWVARTTPLGNDATMAIMLALFYGGGLMLMRIILSGSFRGKGRINSALLGSATSITVSDIKTIVILGCLCLGMVLLLHKEYSLYCFDATYAHTLGFRSTILSPLLLSPAVLAVVLGVKAVGLILMVAFAIVPPAAARQWTNRMGPMVVVSSLIGGFSAAFGTWLSVSIGKVPTGPLIVLVLTAVLLASLCLSPSRSLVLLGWRRRQKRRELAAACSVAVQSCHRCADVCACVPVELEGK